MKRYLVTVNTAECTGCHRREYGVRIGVIGIFDSFEEAVKAKEKVEKKWPMLVSRSNHTEVIPANHGNDKDYYDDDYDDDDDKDYYDDDYDEEDEVIEYYTDAIEIYELDGGVVYDDFEVLSGYGHELIPKIIIAEYLE